MRALLIVTFLFTVATTAGPLGQAATDTRKPSPTMGRSGPGLPRAPSIVWRREMSQRTPQPVPAEPMVPPAAPLDMAVRVPVIPGAAGPRLPPPPWPVRSNRDQLLETVGTLRSGVPKSDVFAALGKPAYSIGIPEGGHYIERCRFRVGMENLVSIEFRDGVLTGIDRIAP
jgi:hypothetical protein